MPKKKVIKYNIPLTEKQYDLLYTILKGYEGVCESVNLAEGMSTSTQSNMYKLRRQVNDLIGHIYFNTTDNRVD